MLILVVVSEGYAVGSDYCAGCDTNDCSSTGGLCSGCVAVLGETKIIGCERITPNDPAQYNQCGSCLNGETCSANSPEALASFTYTGTSGSYNEPYYCTNYNLPGSYAWKTCYSGSPDSLWVSASLACRGGALLSCTGTEGQQVGDCEKVGGFYLDPEETGPSE